MADGIHYFADYHRMIAGIEPLKDAAFQRCESSRNQGHTSIACIPFDASEAVLSGTRETHRKRLLSLPQDVDSEVLRLQEVVQNSSLMVDTHQHQRRLQGNRCERVHRHAVWSARGVEYRGNRHAGRKLGASPQKGLWTDAFSMHRYRVA